MRGEDGKAPPLVDETNKMISNSTRRRNKLYGDAADIHHKDTSSTSSTSISIRQQIDSRHEDSSRLDLKNTSTFLCLMMSREK